MSMKLVPPVTYQGGKQRLAKQIVDIIAERNSNIKSKRFYDLCCGSGAITLETINRDLFRNNSMCDISVWGDFWKSIGDGNFLIEQFELYIGQIPSDRRDIQKFLEDMYKVSPYDGVSLSHVYKFLILQAGAFGGKQIWIENGQWMNGSFRSYWLPTETSNRRYPVNPMMPMPDTLLKRVSDLWMNLHLMIDHTIQKDIGDIYNFEENSIIYVDPPYRNTTGYGNSFDVLEWVLSRKKINPTCKFYVSEKEPIGDVSFRLSGKRSKGKISGNGSSIEEWLTEI